MGKCFRSDGLDQILLLPPSLHDWLPEKHLARFVAGVVQTLDLSALYSSYDEKDGRGQAAYHPAMMVRVLLYGYCIGVASSRQIERKTYEDVAFRYLSADEHPDHSTLSEFRKRHLNALAGLFTQALQLCQKAGLVKLGHVAIDGSKIQANASKHKAMSYGRMSEAEQKLQAEVDELLRRADEADAAEEKAAAEAKIAARREQEARTGQKPGGRDPEVPDPEKAVPEDKAQRNFTDPESRIMPDGAHKGSFVQGYNAQIAVDGQAQVIVATAITQEANDKQQLAPMLERVEQNTGVRPEAASADSGYWSEAQVSDERVQGIDLHVATGRQKHGQENNSASKPPQIPEKNSSLQQMKEKLKTEAGRAVYRMRKAIVEPVFGQIKERRGFRRFSFRGAAKVRAEWDLICLTHNLLKLFHSGCAFGEGLKWSGAPVPA
jgi:transposase